MNQEIFENMTNAFVGNAIGKDILAMAAGLILVSIIIFLGIYIYSSIAWMRIGKNQKYKNNWLAWIPFARSAMKLEMGGFHWALIFLLLIPIAGWIAVFVLVSISMWKIFEKSKYEGAWALSYPLMAVPFVSWVATVAYYILIGFVAWKKK